MARRAAMLLSAVMTTVGAVFAIGGNECKRTDSRVLAAFVARAGGSAARIVVVPSASAQPVARAAQYVALFRAMGAGAADAVHPERGRLSAVERRLLMRATGIFVPGGDQVELMRPLESAGAAEPIRTALRRGAIYAGTSAGAACVSARMIAGTRHDDHEVSVWEGLGLLPGVIVDQHFSERQRLPRLIAAVERLGLTGVGIDEDTAMVWEGDTHYVVGRGTVTVVRPESDGVRIAVLCPREQLEAAG